MRYDCLPAASWGVHISQHGWQGLFLPYRAHVLAIFEDAERVSQATALPLVTILQLGHPGPYRGLWAARFLRTPTDLRLARTRELRLNPARKSGSAVSL